MTKINISTCFLHPFINQTCQVIIFFNVELKLALVAIQKYLVLLHDYLGPNIKKLFLHTHTNTDYLNIKCTISKLSYYDK